MKTELEQLEQLLETLLKYQTKLNVTYDQLNHLAIELIKEGYGNISEYKAEIKRLKSEYEQLQTNAEILANGVRDLNHENYVLTEKNKQAQIDILNELKSRHDYAVKNMGYPWDISQQIDRLIAEVEKQ